MKDTLAITIVFKAWEVDDPGPIALELIELWKQNPEREVLQLYHKNTPVSPLTIDNIKANVKHYDFLFLKLKSSLKRNADTAEFYIVQPYPAMQEKYPEGVCGLTSTIEIRISLEKVGVQKGYCIEDFAEFIQTLILRGNVRSVSMHIDTEAMTNDGYYVDLLKIGRQGVRRLDIFTYLDEYEMKKQFSLVGGEKKYLSVCANHNVTFNFSSKLNGCFIKMPFDFRDSPELRDEIIALNQELCDI